MRRFPFEGERHPPTPEQRAAILRDGHTLIEAGAGSGKTSTLVDKIVYLLGAERFDGVRVAEPCELHQLAAITFTNASAADFKRKLREKLRFVADFHAERGEAAEEQRWRARVHEVDRARIGTIHSFCGGILREFGLRVGLDPRFATLDEGEAATRRDEAARETLRDALEADDADAVALCGAFGVDGARRQLATLLERGAALDQVHAAWLADGDPAARLQEAHRALHAELELEAGVDTWNEALDPAAARLAASAVAVARRGYARLLDRMAAGAELDFDQLVLRTLQVLRERADVRAALQRRLRWLFIDEFQDTDGDQLAIARLLAAIDAPAGPAPRLCIVGDPKQSIYRFRGADVTVWRQAVELFASLGIAPVRLVKNFRSLSPIVGYVNATFDGLIGSGSRVVMSTGQEVEFAALEPHHVADDEQCVELLRPAAAAEGNAEGRRRQEARCIAARLRELVDEGFAWRDMALLFRARTPMTLVEEELRALGIPCYVAGGSGFFARREVRDVRLLLRAMADPLDDVAWLGVLRSPFVGVTDAAIWQWRAGRRDAALSAMLRELDDPALARAREWLLPLVALRDRVSTAQLVDMALERSGYAAQLLTRPEGRLALANLRKLSRLAEGRAGETLGEFLAWIEEREGSEARDADAALYTSGEDVVTLSTIHGAKGLEWPVVVLADLDRPIGSQRNAPAFYLDARAGMSVKLRDDDRNVPGLWSCLKARDAEFGRSEEKRLWYVAATRAKARLILCGTRDEKAVTEWLLRAVDGRAAERAVDEAERPPRTVVELPALPPPAAGALTAQLRPVVASALLPRRSATELMALARGEAVWRTRYAGSGVLRQFRGISPRVIGDVVHGALEELREAQDLLDYLETELVARSGEPAGSLAVRQAAAQARALVERAREHPDVVRVTTAGGEHELPFTWFARSATGVHHVRGAMDLVAVVDGVPEILDFKSSDVQAGGEGSVAARYELQRATYAAALHTLLGVAPARFTFVFPATGGRHVDEIDAPTLESGRAAVHALLDGAAQAR